jgi:hypothetical protein
MRKKITLAIILSAAFACAAVAGPLANNVNEWSPMAKKQLPASPKSSGYYTMQGADLIADAPAVTVGGPYTGTTVGYTNDYDEVCPYTDSESPDVVYRFTTTVVGSYTFDLCESAYDTKLYIYAADLTLEGCNDDFCPGYRSYLEIQDLPVGDHYIVIDGYGGDQGDYSLLIGGMTGCIPVDCPNGIDEVEDNGGCNSDPFVFNDIQCGDVICGNAWVDADNPDAQRDTDWFRLEITTPQILDVTLEVDEFDAILFVIADPQGDCDITILNTADENGYCEDESLTTACLEPGLYYIWVGANTFYEYWDGNYVLTVGCTYCGEEFAGEDCNDPIVVDSYPYFDEGCTTEYMNDIFNESPDVFYQFTTDVDQAVTVSLCTGSDFDTYLWILSDDCATLYAENDDACGYVSEVFVPCMPAGTYYAVIEGYSSDAGHYTIDIALGEECGTPTEGEDCETPIPILQLPYSDSQNSCDFEDDGFSPSSDVFYHLTMDVAADLIVTLCDVSGYDTYLRLLAEDCSTELFSNDDYCGAVSQMDLDCLEPGEYYIVVEGYSSSCGEYNLDIMLGDDCLTEVEPTRYALRSNYPNPFNPSTTIEFTLAEPSIATLNVYSVTGELISTLVDGNLPAGHQSVTFNASNLPSGVYFYTLKAGSFSDTKKMVLVK